LRYCALLAMVIASSCCRFMREVNRGDGPTARMYLGMYPHVVLHPCNQPLHESALATADCRGTNEQCLWMYDPALFYLAMKKITKINTELSFPANDIHSLETVSRGRQVLARWTHDCAAVATPGRNPCNEQMMQTPLAHHAAIMRHEFDGSLSPRLRCLPQTPLHHMFISSSPAPTRIQHRG
jgi:hypothetical protein